MGDRQRQGTLILDGVPDAPASLVERLRPYQNARAAVLRGWLPTGEGLLISTRFADTSQVHVVTTPGGARRQLTFAAEPVGSVAVPADRVAPGFLWTRDEGGSECYQIFRHDLTTGLERRLSDGVARHGAPVPSPDGTQLAYASTARTGRDWDVYVRPVAGDAAGIRLTSAAGTRAPDAWSPDGRQLLVSHYVSIRDNRLYAIDLETGDARRLAATDHPSYAGGPRFSVDGASVFYLSDADADVRELCRLDLASGAVTRMTSDVPWGIETLAPSTCGDYLAYVVNEEGYGRLCLHDLRTDQALPAAALPAGIVTNLHWHPTRAELAFTLHTPDAPADVYSLSVPDDRLTRWTESEAGGLASDAFVVPELIRYPTFDNEAGKDRRRTIPAWYFRPATPSAAPLPVVIAIHGGPESQARPTFQPLFQYWLRELGCAVLQPNVRGSAGYGKAYVRLDDGRRREDSVRDISALLDWIATRPELDAARVAVYGGSYGGYMVLASMIHDGDRLCGGIDLVGISNFVTFLENTGDYRRDLRRMEYGDERDPAMRAFLAGISPTARADEIRKPLLIAQGRNDPRVPASEAEQIFDAVQANGGAPWYFLAEDEGHGFQKKKNRDVFDRVVVMFLERVLGL